MRVNFSFSFLTNYSYIPQLGVKADLDPSVFEDIALDLMNRHQTLACSDRTRRKGSFSTCYFKSNQCIRFTGAEKGRKFLERVSQTIQLVSVYALSCEVSGYGEIFEDKSGEVVGFVILMEKLVDLPPHFSQFDEVCKVSDRISLVGFHNDFKIDNLMLSGTTGELHAIDFDYLSANKMCISVSSFQTIELDLSAFFLSVSETHNIAKFRSFYDLFYLSLSIPATHRLCRPLLLSLQERFRDIRKTVLEPLLEFLGPEKSVDLPMEILARCPGIDAVSVNLTDLRGNAFAHQQHDWESFDYIIKSKGVYWSDS